MQIKKAIGKIHLWLGLGSGLIVCFLGITGCILAFQHEIEHATQPYRFVEPQNKAFLAPSVLQIFANDALPGKKAHSVTYGHTAEAVVVAYFNASPQYYYLAYLNPYTGKVLKVKDMRTDFFRVVIMGHFYLWLPPAIGQPIVATATLMFLVLLISGLILWWPKNKSAGKKRFSIKWKAKWRRVNYDMHNVLGFYAMIIALILAYTGLMMGFQWFQKSVYWAASGGKKVVQFYEPPSTKLPVKTFSGDITDRVWKFMGRENPDARKIEVHYPESDSSSVAGVANYGEGTYWKTDTRYFDRYTMKELDVKHIFGRLKNLTAADKLLKMNYDIHVGAIIGLPGKILAFCASLLCASLPVTGFVIWWGRRNKNSKKKSVVKRGVEHLRYPPARKTVSLLEK